MVTGTILLLAKRFSYDDSDPWLFDELAEEFANRGYLVDVLLLDLGGAWPRQEVVQRGKVRIIVFPVKGKGRLSKIASFVRSYMALRRFCCSPKLRDSYDLLICSSIVSVFYGVRGLIGRKSVVRNALLCLWDFFPRHQYEIGKIKGFVTLWCLRLAERRNVFAFENIGLMSPKNMEFFKQYYPGYRGRCMVVPVWGRDRRAGALSNGRRLANAELNIVFGGQITAGRGISEIVDLGVALDSAGIDAVVHVFGKGDLAKKAEEDVVRKGLRSVKFWGHVPRDEYRAALGKADVGLVATVPGVSVPTFPSKVIDYWVAGVPVIAAVEAVTDFGEIVERDAKGGVAVPAGDIAGLVCAIQGMIMKKRRGELDGLGKAGREYFLSRMEVGVVVSQIEAEVLQRRVEYES